MNARCRHKPSGGVCPLRACGQPTTIVTLRGVQLVLFPTTQEMKK